MASVSRERTVMSLSRRWNDRELSPERTKIWTAPRQNIERKVPVVYYLTRNGSLEHPHFMEVPLSSSEGLYLIDVINRLNVLRGKGMPNMFSWSSKRSYKGGFVWHDLTENDFIHPAHGNEYILKGSELLETSSGYASQDFTSSSTEKLQEVPKSYSTMDFHRKNRSWGSMDLGEYKVYKTESIGDSTGKATDASTQTYDRRRRKKATREENDEQEQQIVNIEENPTTELSREEISPPSSSPETLESLIKADARVLNSIDTALEEVDLRDRAITSTPSGRIKASAVLMQLISCGSISVKDTNSLSLISHYRPRLPRDASNETVKDLEHLTENPSFVEEKEYFSGSLVETKKEINGVSEYPELTRSSSYNADRCSKSDLLEKDLTDVVRSKCMPRKPRPGPTTRKKEGSTICRSAHGSKRITEDPVK